MLDGLPLALNRQDGRPMAVQLADGLRSAAGRGTLRVGDRLPSTRALAATLRVSRTVTAAAYDALAAEGWIQGRHGAGTYIIAAPATPACPALTHRPAKCSSRTLNEESTCGRHAVGGGYPPGDLAPRLAGRR